MNLQRIMLALLVGTAALVLTSPTAASQAASQHLHRAAYSPTQSSASQQDVQRGVEMCDSLISNIFVLTNKVTVNSEPATGKKYRNPPSVSVNVYYENGLECHVIVRNGRALHGPHARVPDERPTVPA